MLLGPTLRKIIKTHQQNHSVETTICLNLSFTLSKAQKPKHEP